MLILSRKENQSIMIGSNIEICVTDISGDKISLGISSPRNISVHRKEVYDAIKMNQRSQCDDSEPEINE